MEILKENWNLLGLKMRILCCTECSADFLFFFFVIVLQCLTYVIEENFIKKVQN